MANKYVEDGVVGINPKYSMIINHKFNCWDDQNKFMKLVDASHFETVFDEYGNYFFPVSQRYRQRFLTAKEISEYMDDTYTAPTLMKYVRMGLMEMEKGKPNIYCFPADFFVSNDLSIDFKASKQGKHIF